MKFFDIHTIILTAGIAIMTVSIFILSMALWFQTRKRFQGMAPLAVGFAMQAVGWLLIVSFGFIPDFISLVVSNILVIGGVFSGYIGMEHFVKRLSRQTINWFLLGASPFAYIYYTFVDNSSMARSLISAIIIGLFFFQYTRLLLYRVGPSIRPITKWVGIIYGFSCLTCCLWIILIFFLPAASIDYRRLGGADAVAMILFQVQLMMLMYSLVLMVNKRLLINIQSQEEKFSKAFLSSPYALILIRLSDQKILEVNDGFVGITGYHPDEVLEKSTFALQLWDKEEDRTSIIQELLSHGKVRTREAPFRKNSGELFIGLCSAEIITIQDEKHILASIDDITEQKRAEEQIRHLANHDTLTDLPSMRLARDRFSMALSLAHRNRTRIAVMFIDLDGFKAINDVFGHDAGDHVLKQVAKRLLTCVRETDTAARIGGDEFLLIMPEIHTPENTAQIARKIINLFSQPIDFNGKQLIIGVSIGISIYPDNGEGMDTLIKQADDAMYRVKKAGKNGYLFATDPIK